MRFKFNPFTGSLDAVGGDAITALLNLLGTVANEAALPSSGNTIGDAWQAEDTGEFFVWDGTAWDGLGDFGANTDLTYDADTRTIESSTGTDAELPLVSTSTAGLAPATSFSTITYAAQVALDFASLDAQYRTISLTGDLELTTSNLANGRTLVLRLAAGATQRTLTFPVDWKFIGAKPSTIAASKTAVLSLTAFGTANTDVVAAYAVQG